jgi:hypothetical protein
MIMETMIADEDYLVIVEKLQLPPDSTYETIISSLYFIEDKKKRKKIVDEVSEKTKGNFSALSIAIEKTFNNSLVEDV